VTSPERLSLADLGGRATVTVEEVAQVLGVSRGSAYEGVRTGALPSLRLGRRVLVPVPALLSLLGATTTEECD
jgi:excisionase family DNA binding protein